AESLHDSIPVDRDIFGRFIGKWRLRLTIFKPDGTSQNHTGEWHFYRILQGRAIQDLWVIPGLDPNGNNEFLEYGTTVRSYNPKTGKWKAAWTGPIQNQLFVFDIEDDDQGITLTEVGNPHLNMKWSFFDIHEDAFQWKSEMQIRDTGQWFVNYHMKLDRVKD
ncbi:MAG: hypothetical protein AAGA85_28390, partial [Bacteroidota bacterium]